MNKETGKMKCPSCGAEWFSAAAEELVAKGHRCLRCDSQLVLANDDDTDDESKRAESGCSRPPKG